MVVIVYQRVLSCLRLKVIFEGLAGIKIYQDTRLRQGQVLDSTD